MIISASRRTDIPALYGDWFINRVRAGFAVVRNPVDGRPVRVPLTPETVDVIVFWTKNPRPFFDKLDILDEAGFSYWFRFTLNGYGRDIEPGLDAGQLTDTFAALSERLGRARTVWAYDPVLFAPGIDEDWHIRNFEKLSAAVGRYTDTCILSLYDDYHSGEAARAGIRRPSDEAAARLCRAFADIAGSAFRLQSCADALPVEKGACIDRVRAERVSGCRITAKKDAGQRHGCRCIESVDIGCYDSCTHFCRYCYANRGTHGVLRHTARYDPDAPMLLDTLKIGETVGELPAAMQPRQLNMFGG